MAKGSKKGPLGPTGRFSAAGQRPTNAGRLSEPQIPASVADAIVKMQSLLARNGLTLEELQGAVEFLLDQVRAAQHPVRQFSQNPHNPSKERGPT
jgi:hypothetical protein